MKSGEKEPQNMGEYHGKDYSLRRETELYGQELTFYLIEERSEVFNVLLERKEFILLLYLLNLLLPSSFVYILYHSLYDRVAVMQEYLERIPVLPIGRGRAHMGRRGLTWRK